MRSAGREQHKQPVHQEKSENHEFTDLQEDAIMKQRISVKWRKQQ